MIMIVPTGFLDIKIRIAVTSQYASPNLFQCQLGTLHMYIYDTSNSSQVPHGAICSNKIIYQSKYYPPKHVI